MVVPRPKVRRILHYKGLAYETEEISMQQAVTRVRKVNPVGKLPALVHDGRTVADSTDIALYLEEHFPDPPLLPSDPRERGLCHALEDWADESLYFYEMYLRFTLGHNSERWIPVLCGQDSELVAKAARFVIPRHMKAILVKQGLGRKTRTQVVADVERHTTAVQSMLSGRDWLVSHHVTVADIAVYAQFACIGGSREGARAIAACPDLQRWMARVEEATDGPPAASDADTVTG
jgi:glutathione S-transferase